MPATGQLSTSSILSDQRHIKPGNNPISKTRDATLHFKTNHKFPLLRAASDRGSLLMTAASPRDVQPATSPTLIQAIRYRGNPSTGGQGSTQRIAVGRVSALEQRDDEQDPARVLSTLSLFLSIYRSDTCLSILESLFTAAATWLISDWSASKCLYCALFVCLRRDCASRCMLARTCVS